MQAAAQTSGTRPPSGAYPNGVGHVVARLHVLLKRQMGTLARTLPDLTVVETRLLLLLGIFAPTSVNDLAIRSDIDRTQISRSIGVLAERGLVARTHGAVDRREVMLTLTGSGQALHDRILSSVRKHNGELIEGLSPAALQGFFEVMERLTTRAQQLLGDPLQEE